MPDRSIRLLLRLASGLCFVFAAAMLLFSLMAPIDDESNLSDPMLIARVPVASPESLPDQLDEQDFQYVWGKTIQQSIVDAPVVAAPPTVAPAPAPASTPRITLQAKLVGTLVDDNPKFARAWIEFAGKKRMVSPGDILEGHPGSPSVESIEHRLVTVAIGGEPYELQLDEPALLADVRNNAP